MAIDFDKKLGAFPLKVWLAIGAVGIGGGLLLAKHAKDNTSTAQVGALAVPPQVIFNRVVIGLEHVPSAGDTVPAIKPDIPNPIMTSNPAASVPIVHAIPLPSIPQSFDYTAVNPDVWQGFLSGNHTVNPVTARQTGNTTQPLKPSALDASGNAYF